ncbi:MAG: Nramp family divalent metal transporter [Parachlamydiaceae bacterium]|nr:Nramp family divalent metal transporter [Parachlamydiaceae bacterium]
MKKRLKHTMDKLGPGLITGCSDDDPSGIVTYTQAGAQFGLATLWTAFITYPLMYTLQEICARIGIVTGFGLAGVIKKYYSKFLLYPLLVIIFPAITFNIAANLAGMGAVAHLLYPSIPIFAYSCIFTIILIYGLFFFNYQKLAYVLKWLCGSLFVYFFIPFSVEQNWTEVLSATFIPYIEWNKEFITILVAILGTTISPYLFFWQANMSVEQKNHHISNGNKEIREMKFDVNIGMLFSNAVMFFIILTAGTILYPQGITHISTVKEAAEALKPLAGEFAYLLFSLGVLGTGFLAIPVLAGCLGYIFSDVFDWKDGLDKTPKEAKKFYSIMLASTIFALLINLCDFDPIKALIFAAILYGLISPILILIILIIANSKKIMGKRKNGFLSNLIGIITFLLMTGSACALIIEWL